LTLKHPRLPGPGAHASHLSACIRGKGGPSPKWDDKRFCDYWEECIEFSSLGQSRSFVVGKGHGVEKAKREESFYKDTLSLYKASIMIQSFKIR